jgi:hypothetical protein
MIDRRFLLQCIAVILPGGLAAGFWWRDSPDVFSGVMVGLAMSTVNAVAASLSIGYAFDKPQNTFLKVVFGGMIVRMGVLLGSLFVLIKVFRIDVLSLALTLFGFNLIFLVMEILAIQRRVQARETTKA